MTKIAKFFRGFLPIVVDVETAGFDPEKDALLEVAAVVVEWDGVFAAGDSWHEHIEPFEGANLDKDALEFTGIKPNHPFRFAKKEQEALVGLTEFVEHHQQRRKCSRAIMVGHNTHFDLGFINAAYARCGLSSPFHRFSVFDTVSLGGVVLGETVLARCLTKAQLGYDANQAHGALYDAMQTAKLFSQLVNRIKSMKPSKAS